LVSNQNTPKSDPVDSGFMVYCLGTFEIYRNDIRLLENGYSRKGLLIFKYLLLNRGHPIRKEVLMDLLWPDSDEQAQRNNLNVAIYSLRQMFHNGDPDLSYILFQNDCYCFNSELEIWTDFEAFLKHYRAAQRLEAQQDLSLAVQEYQTAEMLYQGEFLPEDLYEEWLEPQRQLLRTAYLSTLSRLSSHYFEAEDYTPCISALNKTLEVDSCHEEAHCHLMRCYSRQKQPYLAQRQYDLCVKSLAAELAVDPLPETTALYQQIRAGEPV
jgi:DNA-binding SARP family transcriptional activator